MSGTDRPLLSRLSLWLYSLANLANGLSYSTFNSYAIFFYTDHLNISASLIGQAWLYFGIWNTVNDLIFGWLSDKIPARLGRRMFFMLLFSIPLGLAFYLVWNPPGLVLQQPDHIIFWYFLILISFFDLFQTAANISQGAAFPEIATDTATRTKLAGMRQLTGIIGVALGIAVSPIVYGQLGWQALGIIWGAITASLYILATVGMKDHPVPKKFDVAVTTGWWHNMRLLFANRPFVILMAINFAIRFSVACLQIGMPFYASYVLGLTPERLSLLLGLILGGATLAIPFWPFLIKRVGLRVASIIAVGALIALLIPFFFITKTYAAFILALLVGPAYSGVSIMLDMLYAEVVDLDVAKVGYSRAGIISGIIGTTLRFSPAVAGFITAQLLSVAHYDPLLSNQPPTVQIMLRLIMTLLPAVSLIISAILLYFYPVKDKKLAIATKKILEAKKTISTKLVQTARW